MFQHLIKIPYNQFLSKLKSTGGKAEGMYLFLIGQKTLCLVCDTANVIEFRQQLCGDLIDTGLEGCVPFKSTQMAKAESGPVPC